ncbi:transglycosylase domain-containing protein [Methylobrevis albus]|nr:penicillin-binding protein 1A [Methylobrevis albus]
MRAEPRRAPRGPAKAPAAPPPRRRGGLFRFLRGTIYWGMVLGIWGVIVGLGVLGYYAAHLPATSEWSVPKRPPNVEILDADGRLIANRGDTGGEAIRLEQLPPYLPQAVIAIEDRRFYSHFGIDPLGLARAVVVNLTAGDVVQGGSTLTQQLAKNLFLEPDRTIGRKMQEVVLALWLEWNYGKDEILEMYLNRVYLGAGAYGVDGAARRYFGKPATEVNVSEAATLAGLLRAPSRYAPTRNPELAARRAETVLAVMAQEGYISAREAETAVSDPARVVSDHVARAENYVADWVMDLLPGYVGAIRTDLVVETTVDVGMQDAAEAALKQTLAEEGTKQGISQGALVAIDGDGAVRALVGGRDYGQSQFNRAVSARRQPGSAFKPFVFLAALERGWSPDSVMVDEPITIRGWQPKNYTKDFLGPVSLTTALAKSINTVAARLAAEVGPANVTRTARRLGIVSKLHDSPSIALGTAEVTPLEITAAYVPFSNGGFGVIPYVVSRILDADGKVLFQRNGDGPGRVASPEAIGAMNRMLQATIETGTGRKAMLDGRPAGGKTGTSQEFRDAWFIGYTTGLTAGVWMGNDDGKPTDKVTGGSVPAIAWKRFMTAATAGRAVQPLPGTWLGAPAVLAAPPAVAMPQSAPPRDAAPAGRPTGIFSDSSAAQGPTDEERGLLDRLFGG